MDRLLALETSEAVRLRELRALGVLDIELDGAFAALTRAAGLVAATPMAMITLIDDAHGTVQAPVGISRQRLRRQDMFCNRVVSTGKAVLVPDLCADTVAGRNRYVTGAPGVRSYAGFPLRTAAGNVLGALCVLDVVPRTFDAAQVDVLTTLADQVVAQLALRRVATEATQERDEALHHSILLDAVLESVDVGILCCDAEGRLIADNAFQRELFGFAVADLPDATLEAAVGVMPLDGADGVTHLAAADRPVTRALHEGRADLDVVARPHDRPPRSLRMHARALIGPGGEVLGAVCASHDTSATHRREAELSDRVLDVERVADASRRILGGDEPGQAACDIVRSLCDAQQVTLLIPRGGALIVGATTEPALRLLRMPLDTRSLTIATFTDGRARTADWRIRTMAQASPLEKLVESIYGPVGSALYLPLLHAGAPRGVLVVTTHEPLGAISGRVQGLLDVVTAELATVLERVRMNQEMATQASTDPLTGLANRRWWDDRISHLLANRRGAPLCLAVLDLDHFKLFNDTHGHQAGDAFLQATTRAWAEVLRGTDLMARLGGDEFGVLLPGCSLAHAAVVLDSLRRQVPAGESVSIGVAELRVGESARTWYDRADRALYAAKDRGRNQVLPDAIPSTPRPRVAPR